MHNTERYDFSEYYGCSNEYVEAQPLHISHPQAKSTDSIAD